MRWIDGHLDLAYLAVSGRNISQPCPDLTAGCISLPELHRSGVDVAFATIFTEPSAAAVAAGQAHAYASRADLDAAERCGMAQFQVYHALERRGEIRIVRTSVDLDGGHEEDAPIRCVLLMEGADPIRSPEAVPEWHARGVRIVGLTWAAGTRYAGGNGCVPGEGPLTKAGLAMIRALDDAGIVHDASHLSDRAFDGLMEHARGRVIASHSNCRALLDSKQRHLRDSQIEAIAQRRGIIGLNLYSPFLAVGRRATVADCVAHVEHICAIMGHRQGVALGSDMDGGFAPTELPQDLDHPAKLPRLAEALWQQGWTDDEVRGFARNNWLRFMKEALASPNP